MNGLMSARPQTGTIASALATKVGGALAFACAVAYA
jgi:hypothetical protein